MQKTLNLFVGIFLLFLTSHSFAQTFNVCNNSEVTFDMEEGYWGEPVFEYSTDSLNWEEVVINVNEAFQVNEGMSGYYRLKMVDIECDSSYVSTTRFINVSTPPPIEITINSFFINQIPLSVNPTFWIYPGDSSLSNVIFYVDDQSIPIEGYFQSIENPEESFTIYATAYHDETGCTIYSDTAEYDILIPTSSINGVFDVQGNFNLDNVSILSQIDSVPLNGNNNFSINYSSALELDFVYAIRTDNQQDSGLVSIKIVETGDDFIEVNNVGTALALVMLQPDINLNLYSEYASYSELAEQNEDFDDLVELIDEQLQNQGFLDLTSETLNFFLDGIASDILNGNGSGFTNVNAGARTNLTFPTISHQADGSLLYGSNGYDFFCGARFYNENYSGPSSVVIMPPNNSVWQSNFAAQILEVLITYSNYAQPLTQNMPRWDKKLTVGDITSADDFMNLKLRLVDGQDSFLDQEEQYAQIYNRIYLMVRIIAVIPSAAASLYQRTAAEIIALYEIVVNNLNTFLSGGSPDLESYFDFVATLASLVATGLFAKYVIAVSLSKALGKIATDLWFQASSDIPVWYLTTKFGDRITHRLQIDHNSNEPYKGVYGSYAYNSGSIDQSIPMRYLLETRRRVYSAPTNNALGSVIYEGLEQDLPNYGSFSLDAIASNTESVERIAPNGSSSSYDGALPFNLPFGSGINFLNWKVSWSPAGSQASLTLKPKFQGNFISDLDGLNENGELVFNASIEPPLLNVIQGADQTGEPNSYLSEMVRAQVTTASNFEVADGYPVRYERITGRISDEIDVPPLIVAKTFYTTSDFLGLNGITQAAWKISDTNPQELKIFIRNPENDEEISAFIVSATSFCSDLGQEVGTACNDGDPITINDEITGDCLCAGDYDNSLDCPFLAGNIGDTCDDGSDDTTGDVIHPNCECIGSSAGTGGGDGANGYSFCPEYNLFVGDECDDGNPETENDIIGTNCNCSGIIVVEVVSPSTGRIWMDRNLGASHVATSFADSSASGAYYQWGKSTPEFTIVEDEFPWDWSSPQNDNLWQGVNGMNNPCPQGFRIPTISEWHQELAFYSFDPEGIFDSSFLKLCAGGMLNWQDGENNGLVGIKGYYWSSTVDLTGSRYALVQFSQPLNMRSPRARGMSVRCIKN